MTTARALLASALLIVAAMAGTAWFAVPRIAHADRFQFVNVGGGETIQLDKSTGTMTRCYNAKCAELTAGERIIANASEDEWEGFEEAAPPE